jgi:hypothetical protein
MLFLRMFVYRVLAWARENWLVVRFRVALAQLLAGVLCVVLLACLFLDPFLSDFGLFLENIVLTGAMVGLFLLLWNIFSTQKEMHPQVVPVPEAVPAPVPVPAAVPVASKEALKVAPAGVASKAGRLLKVSDKAVVAGGGAPEPPVVPGSVKLVTSAVVTEQPVLKEAIKAVPTTTVPPRERDMVVVKALPESRPIARMAMAAREVREAVKVVPLVTRETKTLLKDPEQVISSTGPLPSQPVCSAEVKALPMNGVKKGLALDMKMKETDKVALQASLVSKETIALGPPARMLLSRSWKDLQQAGKRAGAYVSGLAEHLKQPSIGREPLPAPVVCYINQRDKMKP